MNYYILTQGTQSQDNSLIVENGKILSINDNEKRQNIIELFSVTEKKGTVISKNNSSIKITKRNNNFLIEILSDNTDKLNRRIPVELLLKNIFSSNEIDKTEFKNINILLKKEKIEIDDDKFSNILTQLEVDLKNHKRNSIIKLVVGFSFTIISVIIILKYLLKWI